MATQVTQHSVIWKLIRYLDDTTETSGVGALNHAVQAATGYDDMQEVIDEFVGLCSKMKGRSKNEILNFLKQTCGIDLTDNSNAWNGCTDKNTGDTGAITGADAGGKAVKTAKNIVPEPTMEQNATLNYYWGTGQVGSGATKVNLTIPKPVTEDEIRMVTGLYYWWVTGAIQLVYDSYGLSFQNSGSAVNRVEVRFYSEKSNTYASTGRNGSTAILNINMANSQKLSWNNRGDASGIAMTWESTEGDIRCAVYTDRLIAHEMTHALMGANFNWNMYRTLPQFFKEGSAELVHGADDIRMNDMLSLLYGNSKMTLAEALDMKNSGTGEWESYAAGYMLLRYLAKRGAEMHLTDHLVYNTNKTMLRGDADFSGTLSANAYDSNVYGINAMASKKAVALEGNDRNNTLAGGSGNDVLAGRKGNDVLYGGAGADLFLYDEGNDTVWDYAAAQGDVLQLTPGSVAAYALDGQDLRLSVGTGTVTVRNGKDKQVTLYDGGRKFMQNVKAGTAGVTVWGSGADDTLRAGGSGSEVTFVVGTDDGSDVVQNFKLGQDRVSAAGKISSLRAEGRSLMFEVGKTSVTLQTTEGQDIDLQDSGIIAKLAASFVDGKGSSLGTDWMVTGQLPTGMTVSKGKQELTIGKAYDKQADGIAEAGAAGAVGFSMDSSKGSLLAGFGYENINAAAAGAAVNLTGDGQGNRLTGSRWGGRLAGAAGSDTLVSSGTGRNRTTLVGGLGSDTLSGAAGIDIFDVTGNAAGDLDVVRNFAYGSGKDVLRVESIDKALKAFYGAAAEKAAPSSGKLQKTSADVLLSPGSGSVSLTGGAMKETWIGTQADGSDARAYWFGKAFAANTFTYNRTVNSRGVVTKDDKNTVYIGTDAQEGVLAESRGRSTFVKGKLDTLKVNAAAIKGGSVADNTVSIDLSHYYSIDVVDGSASTAALGIDASKGTSPMTLKGGKGNDLLLAGEGKTTLSGGAGSDMLVLGGEAEAVCQFGTNDGSDEVRNFTLGRDRISLSGKPANLTASGTSLSFSVGRTRVTVETTEDKDIDLMDSETAKKIARSFTDAKGKELDISWIIASQLPTGMTMNKGRQELTIGKAYTKQTDGVQDALGDQPLGFALTSTKGEFLHEFGYENINAAAAKDGVYLVGNDKNNRFTGSRLGGALGGEDGDDVLISSGTGKNATVLIGGVGSDTMTGAAGFDFFDVTENAKDDVDVIRSFGFGKFKDMLWVDEINQDLSKFYGAAAEKAAPGSGKLQKTSADVLLSLGSGSVSLVGGAMKETWIATAADRRAGKAYWFGKAFAANTFTYNRTVNSRGVVTRDDKDTVYIGTDAQDGARAGAKGKLDTLKVNAAAIKGGSADDSTVSIDLGNYYSIDVVDGSGSTANLIVDASRSKNATTLKGGRGNDTLVGGKEADTFYYAAGQDAISGMDKSKDRVWVSGAVREIGSTESGSLALFFDAAHTRSLTIAGMSVDDLKAAYVDSKTVDMTQLKGDNGYLISKNAAGTAYAAGLDKAIRSYGREHWN